MLVIGSVIIGFVLAFQESFENCSNSDFFTFTVLIVEIQHFLVCKVNDESNSYLE